MIVKNLGRDSALWQAQQRERDPDFDPGWREQEYMLAIIADALHTQIWQAGSGKGKRPQPLPRPGDTRRHRYDVVPAAEMVDWLGW